MIRSVATAQESALAATVPQAPDAAPPRPERWFRVVAVIACALITLGPMFPTLLSDAPAPRPAIVIACSSTLVLTALSLNEWFFSPRTRYGLFRALAISVVIAVVFGSAGGVLGVKLAEAVRAGTPSTMPPPPSVRDAMPGFAAFFGALTSIFQVGLWAIIFVIPASAEEKRLHALEIQNLRLEAKELQTASELIRLRAQLEPHFLLNTLNLVAGLVTQDPNKARDVLATLGELLTDGLSEARELCTVDEEVAWLRRYTDILMARHGSLQVSWQVASGVGCALMPRLLLQPLVENAVRHGALRKRAGGTVTVRAERAVVHARDSLVCTVHDDGPGLGVPREGAIGLENVRRRLALGRPPGELTMHSDQGGTLARVVMPFVDQRSGDALASASEGV